MASFGHLRKWLLVCALSAPVHSAVAQYYSSGADPIGIHWTQISGSGYRLVCDTSMRAQALRLSLFMDSVVVYGGRSLRHSPKKIDILMHSRTAYSNGLVAWAPSRMEVHSYVAPDGDCQLWQRHVALHEYRHAVQMDCMNKGFSRGMYFVFGEQFLGLVSGLYIPKWLHEGDAVYAETVLSRGGRGRKAAFLQEMRADVMTNGVPSYEQAYFGSYKRELPDYYRMGYLTVSAAASKYGTDLWANAFERVGRRSWSITPFNSSLKRQTGLGKVKLYKESMNFWRDLWLRQDSCIVATPQTVVSHRTNDYSSYYSPKKVGERVVAVKESPDELSSFVVIDNQGNEKTLFVPSSRNAEDFSVRGDTIVWSERRGHVRWEHSEKEIVMLYDMDRKMKKRITRKGRVTSPDLSPDGKSFVAVSTERDGFQHLVAMDFHRHTLCDHALGLEEEISWPRWTDDTHVAAVLTTTEGKQICLWDMESGERTPLTEPEFANIRHLEVDSNTIYFTSDADGNDNIYSLSIAQGSDAERVTSSRFGAAWPSVSNGQLYYSNLTASGYDASVTPTTTRATDQPIRPMNDVADELARLEHLVSVNDSAGVDAAKASRNYSRWNLFRIHSWGPLTVDADEYQIDAALGFASQNLLGTLQFTAGIHYDDNEEELAFVALNFNALYPKFRLEASAGYRDYKTEGYTSYEQGPSGIVYYNYLTLDDRESIDKLDLTVMQPLSFNSGAWSRRVMPYFVAELDHYGSISYKTCVLAATQRELYRMTEWETTVIDATNFCDLGYGVQAYMLRRMATRDVGYRLGLYVNLLYRHSPFGTSVGDIRSARVTAYVPSPFKHHRFMFKAQAQKKSPAVSASGGYNYFGEDVERARGYSSVTNKQLTTLTAQYDLPLMNPDLSIGPVVHIKRLSLSAFYDYSEGKTIPFTGVSRKFDMSSVGLHLSSETYLLQLPYVFTIGARVCYRPDEGDVVGKFLLGVTIR